MRVMPVKGIFEKCDHDPEVCQDQCIGKVPSQEHWADKDFSIKDFGPTDNLALILGCQLDGRWLMGIDIDGHIDIKEFLDLPPTLECRTRRGQHLIFEVPSDTGLGNWLDIFRTRDKNLGYKSNYHGAVDIKYCRGALVSPPSRAKDGSFYEWNKWRYPAFLPESEIIYLRRKRKFAYPNVDYPRKWSHFPLHKDKRP